MGFSINFIVFRKKNFILTVEKKITMKLLYFKSFTSNW